MTQEDKELLISDLCARLPYKPQIRFSIVGTDGYEVCEWLPELATSMFLNDDIEIFPYLRPVSSMTEKEMDRLFEILYVEKEGGGEDWIKINDDLGIKFFLTSGRWAWDMDKAISYLRSIHIDIHHLIEKGLALKAPEGMYYINK